MTMHHQGNCLCLISFLNLHLGYTYLKIQMHGLKRNSKRKYRVIKQWYTLTLPPLSWKTLIYVISAMQSPEICFSFLLCFGSRWGKFFVPLLLVSLCLLPLFHSPASWCFCLGTSHTSRGFHDLGGSISNIREGSSTNVIAGRNGRRWLRRWWLILFRYTGIRWRGNLPHW